MYDQPANRPRNTKRQEDWKHLNFIVRLHLDGRKNCNLVGVIAFYGGNPAGPSGFAQRQMGPFDDVGTAIDELVVEAAVGAYESLATDKGQQGTLWE